MNLLTQPKFSDKVIFKIVDGKTNIYIITDVRFCVHLSKRSLIDEKVTI